MPIKNDPTHKSNCNCKMDPNPEMGFQLARATVPFQMLCDVYSPNEALCKGTLFPELWMPMQVSSRMKMREANL